MVAGLAGRRLLLFFVVYATRAQEEPRMVKGVVGGQAYLSPRNQTSFHLVEWRKGSNQILVSRSRDTISFPSGVYKDRLNLFSNNTLWIDRLQKDDSSSYQARLENGLGEEKIESIQLKVYDVVPKPTVSAVVREGNAKRCEVTLECSVGLEDVTYEWVPPSRLTQRGFDGSNLFVSFNPSLEIYTCRASNPVSSNSSQLILRPPCSWEAELSAATAATRGSVLMLLGHLLLLALP